MKNINIKKLTRLPIKSLNMAVKTLISSSLDNFEFDSKGCIYNDIYYDFRVSRIMKEGKLLPVKSNEKVTVHINQITDDNIFLVLLFKDLIKVYLLEEDLLNNKEIKSKLIYQHKENCYQLHLPFEILNRIAITTFNV